MAVRADVSDGGVAGLPKPARSYTRRMTVANVMLAWGAIIYAMWIGADMASAVVPMMVILVASLLGIYQGIGHFDLRAMADMSVRERENEMTGGDAPPGRRRRRRSGGDD